MGFWKRLRDWVDKSLIHEDYISIRELQYAVDWDFLPGGVLYQRLRRIHIRERAELNAQRAKLGWSLLPEIPEGYEAEM